MMFSSSSIHSSIKACVIALIASVLGFATISCSELESSNEGDSSRSVTIPPHSKGLSPQHQAEFLETMGQAMRLAGESSDGSSDSTYPDQSASVDMNVIHMAMADIQAYGDPDPGTTPESQPIPENPEHPPVQLMSSSRSSVAEFSNQISNAARGCKAFNRSQRNSSGSVVQESGRLMQNPSYPGSRCMLKGDWSKRTATSRLSSRETASEGSMGLSISIKGNVRNALLSADVSALEISGDVVTSNIVGRRRYVDPSFFNQDTYVAVGLKYVAGKGTKLEASESTRSQSLPVDDYNNDSKITTKVVLVYMGTSNPVVYQRTTTTSSLDGKTTSVIRLNSEVIFDNTGK